MTSRLRIHNLKFIQPPPTAALPAADRSWCRRAAAPAMTRLTSAAVPAGTTCRSVRGCQPSAGCPSGHPGRRVHPRRRVATPPPPSLPPTDACGADWMPFPFGPHPGPRRHAYRRAAASPGRRPGCHKSMVDATGANPAGATGANLVGATGARVRPAPSAAAPVADATAPVACSHPQRTFRRRTSAG